jgi:hypothetical protein
MRPPRSTQRPAVPTQVTGLRFDQREIIIAHEPAATPLRAVRNVLIQSSLAELRTLGHYDRYASLVQPKLLEQLTAASLAPGWVSVELAHAHYEACDRLELTVEQLSTMGGRVGERVQAALLVSFAKKVRQLDFDLWSEIGPLHRMWGRVFDGGSVQICKLGPTDELVEERGFSLFRYAYYREAHLAVLRASHAALGVDATVTIASYNPRNDDLTARITWP